MKCFNCDSNADAQIYGIPVCNSCESDLRLFTDDTINRQKMEYKGSKKYATYQEEISDRLILLKRDYLKKKIKLLHILERLDNLK
jgi:hypothetical protein